MKLNQFLLFYYFATAVSAAGSHRCKPRQSTAASSGAAAVSGTASASSSTATASKTATASSTVTASGTATVALDSASGTAAFIANGVHNGIPPNDFSAYVKGTPPSKAAVQTQIPDHFFTGIKLQNARGGQGNLPKPSRGWMYGKEEYKNRFRAFHSDYLTTRKFGGNYTLMLGNLFGQRNKTSPHPGDGGDWTSWDEFVTTICSDLIENDILDGLDIEVWNEPDIQFYNYTPWLQVWGRAFYQLKAKLPSKVRVVGPGLAKPPADTAYWTKWLDFIQKNGSVPDAYTYHHLLTDTDPAISYPIFLEQLSSRHLPVRPVYVNEFGGPAEQKPSYDTWFISRFERLHLWAARANRESTAETTNDYLANTLARKGDTYSPTGSWWVMAYYANMTGTRLHTTPSKDGDFDVFAVSSGKGIGSTKILAGSHGTINPYRLAVTNISSKGYPSSGEIDVIIKEFSWNGLHGATPSPKIYSRTKTQVKNDQVSIHFSLIPFID
uniref:Glycoside hydrolase family 39 protein n=1 Tax=Bionectria ochroleuca TaxID=29856 RepID=A0A8H7N8S0_BIOOC